MKFHAYHQTNQGGYAYRLCKVPQGGISKITEKCFQDGHLDFAGDTSWIYWKPRDNFSPNNWQPTEAVRTKIGTNPPGSEWAKITLPKKKEKGKAIFISLVDYKPGT